MKQYDVKISHAALSDMEQIYSYIADRLLEPDTAMGQYNRIAEAIQSLNILPTLFPYTTLFRSPPVRVIWRRYISMAVAIGMPSCFNTSSALNADTKTKIGRAHV